MLDHPDFDIIIGGRAYGSAPYAAFCIYHGFKDLEIAYHMGKIMECSCIVLYTKTERSLAIVRYDSFDIIPLDPESRALSSPPLLIHCMRKPDLTYFKA